MAPALPGTLWQLCALPGRLPAPARRLCVACAPGRQARALLMRVLTPVEAPGGQLPADTACCSAPGAHGALLPSAGPCSACRTGTAVSHSLPALTLPCRPLQRPAGGALLSQHVQFLTVVRAEGADAAFGARSGQSDRSGPTHAPQTAEPCWDGQPELMRCQRPPALHAALNRSRALRAMAGAPFCVPVEEVLCQGCSWAADQGGTASCQFSWSAACRS